MTSQKNAQHHLLIIITIVVCFSTFMIGYSFSPFMEVGFGDQAKGIDSSAAGGASDDLMKQYQNLYNTEEE